MDIEACMNHSPAQPRSPLAAFGGGTGSSTRRVQPRNVLRCPVTIAIAGGPERIGTTVDLSRDGLSLSTDRPIPPGSRCTLSLRAANDPNAGHSLRISAKSVYSSYSAPGDFRIGMVFLGLEAEVEDALRALATSA